MADFTVSIDTDEIESEIKSAVDSAINDIDVSDVASNADFSDKAQEAVDNADFSDALGDALGHVNLVPALLRALSSSVVQDRISDIVKEAVQAERKERKDKRYITGVLGETVPAFRESPLGSGMYPKPYVPTDPDALLQAEDDEATEAYLAREE